MAVTHFINMSHIEEVYIHWSDFIRITFIIVYIDKNNSKEHLCGVFFSHEIQIYIYHEPTEISKIQNRINSS